MQTYALQCRSCGANLAVPKGLDSLACSYCSTAHIVRSEGGVTFLEADVRHVRAGVERLEAGVADLRRISTESMEDIAAVGRAARLSLFTAKRERLEQELAKAGPGCGVAFVLIAIPMAVGMSVVPPENSPAGAIVGLLVGVALFSVACALGGRSRLQREVNTLNEEIKDLEG